MGTLADVEIALSVHFENLGYPYVSWPAGAQLNDVPDNSTIYEVDVLHSKGMAAAITADADDRYFGSLQIRVLSPNKGFGVSRARLEALAVMQHFKRGTALTYNGVKVRMFTPTLRHIDHPNPAWYCIIIDCPWEADVPVN